MSDRMLVRGGVLLGAALILAGCADEPRLPGEREAIRPVAEVTEAAEPTAVPVLTLPQAQTNANWGHLNGDPTHLAPAVTLNAQLTRVWSADLGRGSSRRTKLITAPIVQDGRVFALDAAAQLTAVSTSGAVLWRLDLIPPGERGPEGFGGGMAAAEGILVVSTGFGEVLRLDPETGGVIWRAEGEGAFRAAPTLAGDKVIAVARGDLAYGIDLATGEVDWRLEGVGGGAGVVGGASPAVRGPVAILPFQSGELRATLVRNGLTVWTAAVTGGRRELARATISDLSGDPVIDNDVVYVSNQAGRLAALDRRNGAQIWTEQDGAFGPVLLVGPSLFVISDTSELLRISTEDGTVLWRVALPLFENPRRERGAITHFGPLLAGGRLIVASSDGVLRSFDPTTGAELAQNNLPDGVAAQPAIAASTLYVVTDNGKLHALR